MPEKLEQINSTPPEQANQEKIDLSQFGLKNDSWLEKVLNGQGKEKNEIVIADISEEISKTFGLYDNYQDIIRTAVFTALNDHWVSRCQTPKDFRQCAEIIIDIAKSKIRHNEKGEANSSQYFDTEKIKMTAFLIEDLAGKIGGAFMQHADTLRLIIKDSIDMGYQEADVVGTMWSLNHDGLSFSGESLRAIRQIVKNASKRGIDVKNQPKQVFKDIFGNSQAKDTGKKNEKGYAIYEPDDTFKKWRSVSGGRFAFDEDLGVIANSFQYDSDPIAFVDKFNDMTVEQQNVFVSNAEKFISKGIPPQVIADNPHLMNSWECDLSKKGLAIFLNHENQKWWLEYCANVWKYNPASIEITKQFFNETLSPQKIEAVTRKEWNVENIRGISQKELTEIQGDVDEELGAGEFKTIKEIQPNQQLKEHATKVLHSTLEELFANKDFDTICKIRDSITGSAELILALDKEKADVVIEGNDGYDGLIKYISALGSDKENVFPLTFAKAKEIIFLSLTENLDLADYFLENLPKYYKQPWIAENILKAVQHYSVAQKFISAIGQENTIWKNEPWVSNVCTQAKVIVAEHEKQWDQDDNQDSGTYSNRHGSEGFRTSDPYENHPWLFGTEQANASAILSSAIEGNRQATIEMETLGLSLEACNLLLSDINKIIIESTNSFLSYVELTPNIPHFSNDDREALIHPDAAGMTPLTTVVRSLVARYIVQIWDGNNEKLISVLRHTAEDPKEIDEFSKNIKRMIEKGFASYEKVHEVEIPLYDKLYEEFDNLRETGRYPLEVFLGRDGIYAWIGRRAQDVARRRKAGLEGRQRLREHGEVLEIHPRYTVYPRYFRDNLNYETKRKFLEQEGISSSADPLFYDTGYTGTIPEQIMKVMDFSDDEIEKRIKLLSAPHAHRRVKGIAENARHEIVEYIEHNAKAEGTAEGLIVDEKTGKIRHIAMPARPEEQFYFMMVKQAISRHYWLQEKLHHEPSGNMNLDSEHYTIRIRQEYAKVLPQDFVKDPKEFLAQHGELLKGSKGEGDYPDEEIILFKMTDGTEIVAKKIELRKAKEARKEFSILISAKKAGLPTAEPVGFVSGKEEKDGSYLLMKKLEGFSGRNFGKHLRDSGKFSEDKIKVILQTIVEKNKEMAELFRNTLKIDKRWRIKDTIIEFNEETGEVGNVTPIDWERAQDYNPSGPKEIDEIV
jgi:hypothetical protein